MQKIVTLLVLALLSVQVQAADLGITVDGAWARATAPGQDSGSVQFSVTSKESAKLVGAATPVAGAVEIHRMTHEDGGMKMRAVESLDLSAGKTLDLGKHGYHVMLLKLKQPLKAGDSVPLTLTVEFADKHRVAVEAKARVIEPGAQHDMHDMMDMGGMRHHGQ